MRNSKIYSCQQDVKQIMGYIYIYIRIKRHIHRPSKLTSEVSPTGGALTVDTVVCLIKSSELLSLVAGPNSGSASTHTTPFWWLFLKLLLGGWLLFSAAL